MEGEKYQPTPEEIQKAEEMMTEEQKMQSESRAEGHEGGVKEGRAYERVLAQTNEQIGYVDTAVERVSDEIKDVLWKDPGGKVLKDFVGEGVSTFVYYLKYRNEIYKKAKLNGVRPDEIKETPSLLRRKELVIDGLVRAGLYEEALRIAQVPDRESIDKESILFVENAMKAREIESKE